MAPVTALILATGFVFVCTNALPAPTATESPEANVVKDSSDIEGASKISKTEEVFSIASWQSPPEVQEKFPFYLSGYDYDERPIGVIELGHWDARAWHRKGKESWEKLERHAEMMLHILKSGIHAKNFTDEDNVTKTVTDELVIIVDFDGFNVAQLTSPPVLTFMTKYLGQLEILQERIAYAYFINVNAVASVVVRLLRPVLGKAMERVEVYGTQRSQWLPIIRRSLPEDQIPEKYGGKHGHKPIKFYG